MTIFSSSNSLSLYSLDNTDLNSEENLDFSKTTDIIENTSSSTTDGSVTLSKYLSMGYQDGADNFTSVC